MAATSLATLRSSIEAHLRGKIASPFSYRDRNSFDLISTGLPHLDTLLGGLPRGAITELCGPPCSGRTSLLFSALASRTSEGEVCALVDARDSFDPLNAASAGIALHKLLWIRCQNIDQALQATDLLIQAGGFGIVAVDLCAVPDKTVRQVPLNAWFRFRRAVEDTPTILLLLEQQPSAKTCASLVLQLETKQAQWTSPVAQALMFTLRNEGPVPTEAVPRAFPEQPTYPFARLLAGFSVHGNVLRSRIQLPQQRVVSIRAATQPDLAVPRGTDHGLFETQTVWRPR
jgi:recombination protein RecA